MSASPARQRRRAIERAQRTADKEKGPRMKVDIDQPFLDNRRKVAKRATGEIERDENNLPILSGGVPVPILAPMTLGDVFIEALADRESDQNEPPKEKLRRARLSDLMLDGGKIELTPADVTLIQQRAGTGLTSTAYLRVVDALGDPDAESVAVSDEPDPVLAALADPEDAVGDEPTETA